MRPLQNNSRRSSTSGPEFGGELDRIREVTGHHRVEGRRGSVGEHLSAQRVVVGADDVLVVEQVGDGVVGGQLLVVRRQIDRARVVEQLGDDERVGGDHAVDVPPSGLLVETGGNLADPREVRGHRQVAERGVADLPVLAPVAEPTVPAEELLVRLDASASGRAWGSSRACAQRWTAPTGRRRRSARRRLPMNPPRPRASDGVVNRSR